MRFFVVLLTLLALPGVTLAQEQIQLGEVIPALAGTELGQLPIGAAPPPGASRTVRRSEVLAALRRAGRDPRGLAIPRSTRIRREARALDAEALAELSRAAVQQTLAPCTVDDLTVRGDATVAQGPAVGAAPRRSGAAAVVVVLRAGGREVRVPAQARVSCPAPIIAPGRRVRVVARFGAVEASAPGVARQPGRVGDVIRVQNLQTRSGLRARVIDADTVEVVP